MQRLSLLLRAALLLGGFAATGLIPAMNARTAAQAVAPRGPDGSTQTRIPGITVLPDPGVPFFGSDTMQWVRTGSDGGTVTKYVEARIARDSQGRLYRERHHFAPAGVDAATTMFEFFIDDPVSGSKTACDVGTHRCIVTLYRPGRPAPLQPAGIFDNGRRSLTRDALGGQAINGIAVEGTRETTAIEPGVDGNDRRLLITNEFWYSPDLKTNILVIRNDPRQGKVTIALKVDSRGEPEPSIFAVPAGYRVLDLRPHRPS